MGYFFEIFQISLKQDASHLLKEKKLFKLTRKHTCVVEDANP
jgi:hypothetical protein